MQAKVVNLFEDLKGIYLEEMQAFALSSGWFLQFNEWSGLHNIKMPGKAASGDVQAAKKFQGAYKKLLFLPDQNFTAYESVVYYGRVPTRMYIAKTN
jgi:hypothetical protein